MNTHIIISIKDIENKISQGQSYLDSDNSWDNLEREVDFLRDLLNTSRQISLDEKDINSKIANHTNDLSFQGINIEGINGFKNGYKQALKDLNDDK